MYGSDPDGYLIQFYVSWGDGTLSGTRLLYFPERPFIHSYKKEGQYTIEAWAVDIKGAESNHRTLSVTVPKNRVINIPFLSYFENHQDMFPILRYLLGL